MRVERITLTHVRVPLVEPFRISSGAVAEKDAIAVELAAGGAVGWGESSPMSGTFYSSDTPESCWRDLCDMLVPAVMGRDFESADHFSRTLEALPGSNFAKCGLETAWWDIEAQVKNVPLWKSLGGVRHCVESGLAVGLYDCTADMLAAIERYLTGGYKRVKIKIEPGKDVKLVEAVRKTFGDIPLFVDANGAYTLAHRETMKRLDGFGLMMIEQPFPAAQLDELADLQRDLRTPVCLDESLDTIANLERAIELESLRIANIKIQRVGGFRNALAVYEICRSHNIPVWVGTMPELGIGQAQGAALASLAGCVFPTDVEASLRWFQDDIIDPMLEVENGFIDIPPRAGLGYSIDAAKLKRYEVAARSFS